jgi:hypothetical protein
MAIKVKKIAGGGAMARTTEYWYLRWWSTIKEEYRYPYRETNRQSSIDHWPAAVFMSVIPLGGR